MWKNTQLGPLFICFKRREPHKSSGRVERSQKAVDVWTASTASGVQSCPCGWQQQAPAVWHGGASWVAAAPATCAIAGQGHALGSAENRVPKRFWFHACQTPRFLLNIHSVCLLPVWTRSRAGKTPQESESFAPSLSPRYTHLSPNQLRLKWFCSPTLAMTKSCFCYQGKSNSFLLHIFHLCRAAFF